MISVIVYLTIMLGVIALDQITKAVTDGVRNFVIIRDILYISGTKNTGAAFSVFSDAAWAQTFFIVITVIAVTLAVAVLFYNKKKSRWFDISLVFVVAGAVGNFIDRIALKYVRDFIYVTFFANFNVADIAISVGAIMLVVYFLFLDKDALIKLKKK